MSKKAEIKEETKKQIRALLLSAPKGLSGRDIQNDFKCMMGKTLPFRELGYSTAEDLFRDLPDVVRVTWVDGEVILRGVSDTTTKHIERLVSRQKVPTKRRGASKNRKGPPPRRYPAPRLNRPTLPPPTVQAFIRGQIRSLLMSYPNGLPANQFETAYARRFGNHIDLARMGFKNLMELMKSLSDIVTVEESPRWGYMLLGRPATQRQYSGDREFQERRIHVPEQVRPTPQPAPSRHFSNDSGVSDGLKRAIQKVLSRKPLGIRAALFPKDFQLVTGREFPVREHGYLSVIEMMDSLSDIVCIERHSPSDWLLFDARLYRVKQTRTSMPGGSGPTQPVPMSTAPPMDIFFKEMVRQVVGAYPKGLDAHQLTDAFEHLTDEPLNIREKGFFSLDAFIAQLSDVLVIETTPEGRTLLHARDTGSSHNILKRRPEDLQAAVEPPVTRGRRGLPADTVGPGMSYSTQSIPLGVDNVEVFVSNIISPSHFWLQLKGRDTTKALEQLMDQLEHTYCGAHSEDYRMPDSLVMVGQVCVAIYPEDNNWHRVTITGIRDLDFVEVYYVDYGSTCSVSKQALRLIRSCYFTLPAQAIKARLANIQPADGKTWQRSLTGKLLQIVTGRPLWALIAHISEDQVVSVCLCDTSGTEDLHINDILVQDGYAVYRQDDYYTLARHLTHPLTTEASDTTDPERQENLPQGAPHDGEASGRRDSETEQQLSETAESEEKLDEDLVPRHVKFVQLTEDDTVHLVKFNDKLHMLSAEVSSLLWQKDILHSMLWQKGISVPRLVLTDEEQPEIFEELLEYEVDGMADGDKVKAQVTVYDLASVLQILDIFEHKSDPLREALQLHLEQFSPDDPYWKGKADSDDEDDGDDSELGVSELEVALQALQFKRQRIIQEMLSAQASPTFVEKLENVEKQLTDVREKILDARALEKSGGAGTWTSKFSASEEMIQHCVGQQYKSHTSDTATVGKSSETRPKSGSLSPGKKTNMVAPMPAVTTPPATLAAIIPPGGTTKPSGAAFPTFDPLVSGGGDSLAQLTPSQQQLLAQYQLLLSQSTLLTNIVPAAVPTLNFGMSQLNIGLPPQSQLLSSTTLLCNTTMPTVANPQLGATPLSAFDPSVLAAMPAIDPSTVGLIGQGRGGALQRNINMMPPPGGLKKRNMPE